MATPTVPASESAAVMSAEIRADTAQEAAFLNAFVKVIEGKRERAKDELVVVIRSLTTLETEMGKLAQDTFVKLADLQRDYYKIVASGRVQPVDRLKAAIRLLELEKETDVALGIKNNVLFDRAVANATLAGPKDSIAHKKVLVETVTTDLNSGLTSPALPGTMDLVTSYLGVPAGTDLSTLGGQNAAEVHQKYIDRKEAAKGVTAKSAALRRALGANGSIEKLGLLSEGGDTAAIAQAASAIAPTLEEALKYAEKFPGKDDLSTRLKDERERVTKLRQDLDADPMMALETFRSSMTKTSQPKRDVDFYKTIGSTKFQRWAASNNLQVGKMRPATTDADKEKVGYISELNAVYEPGPDDQRSLVVAHNQSTMKPGEQLFTRRGLEARRNVEVQVGTKGAEREVLVDASGKEVNPQEVAAKNKFVGKAVLNGKPVYVREDGSGFDGSNELSAQELAGTGAADLTEEQSAGISGAYVDAKMKTFKTEKRPGDPSGVQTLRGRETAMLPTDPADTLYVIETTDGRRVPIRESQMLGETVIGKDKPDAKTKLIEEPRMALRKPLAMLRARGARLKEEAAPAEETEGPVGPLGRATGVMSNAEVKALPSTKFIELPARAGGVSAGTGAAIPNISSFSGRLFNPSRGGTGSSDSNEIARQAIERSIVDRGGFAKPSSEVGRDVRKAAGNEQTGAAAGTVAASIPPIAMGTPMSAPAMPGRVQYERVNASGNKQVEENYEGLGEMKLTPEELADMNAPATEAQKKARAIALARRAKYNKTPATAEQE